MEKLENFECLFLGGSYSEFGGGILNSAEAILKLAAGIRRLTEVIMNFPLHC